jgi:hypothetical protein
MDTFLTELDKIDKSIGSTFETGQYIDYLGIRISVKKPNFRTKMFCKLAAQSYILPFNSAHPLHVMKNIPFSALLRAVRVCPHSENLGE